MLTFLVERPKTTREQKKMILMKVRGFLVLKVTELDLDQDPEISRTHLKIVRCYLEKIVTTIEVIRPIKFSKEVVASHVFVTYVVEPKLNQDKMMMINIQAELLSFLLPEVAK